MTAPVIYLDNHATTRIDPRVAEAMNEAPFGNPSSNHAIGREAREAVEVGRARVAAAIGARPHEIIFTSGATESNNLAIKGGAARRRGRGRVVTSAAEHKCVLEVCTSLRRRGDEVDVLSVNGHGRVDPDRVRRAVRAGAVKLISIMAANNEVGTISDVGEVGTIARRAGALYHVDAAQALGRIPVDVKADGIDLLSASGHKIYGPKGIGFLYIRDGVELEPQLHGGGQERDRAGRPLRSGTLAVPLIVGLGVACELARREMAEESARLLALRRRLYDGLAGLDLSLRVNGDPERRLPGNLNVRFDAPWGAMLPYTLHQIAVSTASACSVSKARKVAPSHVLEAMGQSDEQAEAAIRFGLGRYTTEEEVDFAVQHVGECLEFLTQGPVYLPDRA